MPDYKRLRRPTMPARSKKRSTFEFNGRMFMWYVDADMWIRICSADKKYVVAMLLYDPRLDASVPSFLQVIGQEFPPANTTERPLGIALPDSLTRELKHSMGALVNAILQWSFDPSTQIEHHPLADQLNRLA
ncbi:MAG: hypothetical protein JW818_07830 [Pirellulales bacterium]|nr:hypothetical protein [Pirellulales bacterium]